MLGISIGNNVHVQRVYLFVARKKKYKTTWQNKRTKVKKTIKAPELKRKPSGTLIKERLNFSPFFEVQP